MPVVNTADRLYVGGQPVDRVYQGTSIVWASGPFIQLTGRTAAENATVGTTVGTLSVANPGTGTATYSLTDSAGGKFSLTGATLKVAAALDYETATFHSVTVHVTGMTPNPSDRSFIVLVTDIDEIAPTITSASTVSNAENSVLAHSLTASESVTWSIVGGADQARFELSGSTLRWLSNGVKDFESPNDADVNNAYIVQVRATDLASNQTNQTITVTVTDVADSGTTVVTAPNGMSWTFPGTVVNGTYVNGDVWVYTATTLPMPTMSSAPNGTGEGTQNGGMINPTFNTLVESHPLPHSPYTTPMRHGYDGRVYENTLYLYDATYNAHTNGSVLSPGDSLVSCESMYTSIRTRDDLWAAQSSNRTAIGRMACLTVVNYTPFSDEFRPAYFGTTKTRRRWSDMNLGLLPNLTAPFNPKGAGSSDFHLDTASTYAGPAPYPYMSNTQAMRANSMRDMQYWVASIYGNSPVSMLCPVQQQWWYRREQGTAYGQLACYVLHNFSDRDLFLANIVQAAIDAYAIATGNTGVTPFSCGAGFYATPLWFIRFAGLLFNDTGMKNAATIATTKTDYYGGVWPKWGEQTRVYYSATAHAQYLLPGGYAGLTPLYGDMPDADYSGPQGGNNSMRDPNGVYDAYAYHYASGLWYGTVGANSADGSTLHVGAGVPGAWGDGFFNGAAIEAYLDGTAYVSVVTGYVAATKICTVSPSFPVAPDNNDEFIIHVPAYPNILASTYVQLWPFVNQSGYAQENYAHMGNFLASQVMSDSGFWGGAIADYDKRWANDRQMWQEYGKQFDYSSTDSNWIFYRDLRGLGGSGNAWISYLWDRVNPFSAGRLPIIGQDIVPQWVTHTYVASITAGAVDINGQNIVPVYAAGGGPVTVYSVTLTTGADSPGWGGDTVREVVGAANLAPATGQQIRVTFGFRLIVGGVAIKIYVGQGSTGGDAYDATALVQLTGGDFGSGLYTQGVTTADVVLTSGWVALNEAYNEAKDLVFSENSAGAGFTLYSNASANNAVYYKGAVDDAATANASGYGSLGAFSMFVSKIEIQP